MEPLSHNTPVDIPPEMQPYLETCPKCGSTAVSRPAAPSVSSAKLVFLAVPFVGPLLWIAVGFVAELLFTKNDNLSDDLGVQCANCGHSWPDRNTYDPDTHGPVEEDFQTFQARRRRRLKPWRRR